MDNDLLSLPIWEVAKHLKSREISSLELTNLSLARIEKFEKKLSSFITILSKSAIHQAKKADKEIAAGMYRGPLHGVPISVKDNIYLANYRTTFGSKIYADFIPTYDGGAITKLNLQGPVFLGKTNMHEFALGATTNNPHYGVCRNPWDVERIPGGSSGGSAAAVAANLTFGALGSDTSGSIRVPAAACGLVGLKPTYGRVSKYGCFPEAWSLDTVGTLTRNIRDAAIMIDAISGVDKNDPTTLDLQPLSTFKNLNSDLHGIKIGIEEDFYFYHLLDPRINVLIRRTLETLNNLGAEIIPVKIPSLRDAFWALTIIDTSETTSVHAPLMKKYASDYGDDVRFLIECGYLPTAVDYLQALQIRRIIREDFQKAFANLDVLVAPTLPCITPKINENRFSLNGFDVDAIETMMHNVGPGNLLGLPSLSIPCGLIEGIPIGLELIGPALGEQKILNIALAIEETDPLKSAKPMDYQN